jgi:hypothetical protein
MDAAAGRIFVLAGEGRMTRGRPVTHTAEVLNELLERISEGRPLRSVCEDEDMPSWRTVWRWLQADEDFRTRYARAREAQAHAIAEQAVIEAAAASDPQLGRLAFDARKWFASKVAPKVYGDKQQLEHSGPDGGPIRLTWGDGSS